MDSKTVLGLDVGERRIGVAIGDLEVRVAMPKSVIRRTHIKKDVITVLEEAKERGVGLVVIGDPLRTDGVEKGDTMARQFAKRIQAEGLEVVLWDERYSTKAADRLLSHLNGVQKRSGKLDAVAAQWLLQGYLDSLGSRDG